MAQVPVRGPFSRGDLNACVIVGHQRHSHRVVIEPFHLTCLGGALRTGEPVDRH